jgi:Nucleoside H+ symporter
VTPLVFDNFTVLMVCALLTSISLGVYNSYSLPYLGALGISNVAGVLAIGQASEVACIVTIPFVLARIGMKWALLFGMGMWGIRFTLFALASRGHAWVAIVGVALHSMCNDFFLILSAMYIDRVAPAELRAQAQSGLIADLPANLVRSFAVDLHDGSLSALTEVSVSDPAFVAFAELPVNP